MKENWLTKHLTPKRTTEKSATKDLANKGMNGVVEGSPAFNALVDKEIVNLKNRNEKKTNAMSEDQLKKYAGAQVKGSQMGEHERADAMLEHGGKQGF